MLTPSREAAPEPLTKGRAALLAAAAAALLFCLTFGLGMTGLLGPDEPRYAFIGRHMAETGDYLTPRLWSEGPGRAALEPWFEKPPLLYWLVALGFHAGLGEDVAPRLPVMLVSWAFVVFFWWALRRLEGDTVAAMGAMVLATTAGWFAYSMIAVTDLPLAASFNAALLLGLLRLNGGAKWMAGAAGACFGLALLAKGLVAGVLALPLLWFARRAWRDLGLAAVWGVAVALPWYAGMVWRHGWAFVEEFFLRHHFSRFSSVELQHVQPFWFYVPVLLGLLYPWLPLVVGLQPRLWRYGMRRVWAATFLFGFVFFSASTNKLPGYLLPLFPSLAVLLAVGLKEASETRRAVAAAGMLLALAPAAGSVLPDALLAGIRRTRWDALPWEYVAAALPVAGLAWWWESRRGRLGAAAVVALGALLGFAYIQLSAFPAVDQVVSARGLARRVERQKAEMCVERLHRALRYGLSYYHGAPLPACADEPRPVVLDQEPGGLPSMKRRNVPER